MGRKGKLESLINTGAVKAEFSTVLGYVDDLIERINNIKPAKDFLKAAVKPSEMIKGLDDYDKKLQIVTERIASMNGESKEFTQLLLLETKASKEAAAAKLNEAKAATELSKAKLNEAKANTESTKAKILETKESERLAAAKAKDAAKTAQLNEPYQQLVIRFAAAAREAKNLAAQYGTTDKRAQEAAKAALALNNQLKAIDAGIGNHQREVGNYGKALEGATHGIKHFATELLGLIGIVSVASFFKDSIDAFLELDKATRLLENTLKNIGAPELFGRIEESTHKLTKQFKFLREEDVQTVFNKLIVYGKLTEKQINELLPVIIDFASATGKDLPEAASLITRALEGNTRGLREFGINMKEGANVTERMSLIMTELKPRVEGVAEAFGESAAGKIAASKEEFRKLKEEVGGGLIPVFVNLLGWFQKVLTGLGYLKDKTGEFLSDIGDLFSGDLLVLVGEGNNQLAREEAKAAKIVKNIVSKQLEELKGLSLSELAEVRNGTQLFIIDFQNQLNKLEKQGGEKNVKRIAEVKTSLAIQKGVLEGIFKLQNVDPNKILGPGDPNKTTDKTPKHDAEADFFKFQEERRKFAFETQKKLLQDQIDASSLIVADDKKTFAERIKAAQDFYDFSLLLITKQRDFDLEDIDKSEIEDKRKATKEIRNKAELNKVISAIDASYAAKRLLNQANYNSAVLKLEVDDGKKRTDLIANNQKEAAEHRIAIHEHELSSIKAGYDQALVELDKDYAEKRKRDKNNKSKLKKDEEDYNKEKLRLQVQLQAELLKEDIRFAQAQLDLAEITARATGKQADIDKVITAKQKLTDLEISPTALFADFNIKSNEQIGKSNEEIFNKKIEQLEKIKGYSQEVFGIIGSFIGANAEREKNAIQEQIDALEAKKQKDIEVANQSVGTEQERAAKIAIINARADAQKQQLEARQRQIQERTAKFEKAQNIASIITETAVAVIRALGAKPFSPTNIALAVVVGAIGAAKLAAAIATPIPKYFKQTSDHPGGPAIAGEVPEVVTEPSKGSYLVDKPTFFPDLEKHSTVYHVDKLWMLRMTAAGMHRSNQQLISSHTQVPVFNDRNITDEIKAMRHDVVKAIRKNQQPKSNKIDPMQQWLKNGYSNDWMKRNLNG